MMSKNFNKIKNQRKVIVCDECKHEFYLEAVKIQEDIVVLNGVPVILAYFTCPKCNKIYRVSIQDKRYYELFEDLEKTKKRIRKNHGSNNEAKANMLQSMVLKKQQRLSEHLKRVDKMFPGTFVFVTSENNHKEKTIKYLP